MKLLLSLTCLFLFIFSCASHQLIQGAETVRIVTETPIDCEYLGDVTGSQGNAFSGSFTSNSAMETGARNQMKNKAYKKGGNTLHLLTNRAGMTHGQYGASQTNVTATGGVYNCNYNK
jgi:hypothetical protein